MHNDSYEANSDDSDVDDWSADSEFSSSKSKRKSNRKRPRLEEGLFSNRARRQSHNIAEKRRRDKLNEKLEDLRDMLPSSERASASSKAGILGAAAGAIQELEAAHSLAHAKNSALEQQYRELVALLGVPATLGAPTSPGFNSNSDTSWSPRIKNESPEPVVRSAPRLMLQQQQQQQQQQRQQQQQQQQFHNISQYSTSGPPSLQLHGHHHPHQQQQQQHHHHSHNNNNSHDPDAMAVDDAPHDFHLRAPRFGVFPNERGYSSDSDAHITDEEDYMHRHSNLRIPRASRSPSRSRSPSPRPFVFHHEPPSLSISPNSSFNAFGPGRSKNNLLRVPSSSFVPYPSAFTSSPPRSPNRSPRGPLYGSPPQSPTHVPTSPGGTERTGSPTHSMGGFLSDPHAMNMNNGMSGDGVFHEQSVFTSQQGFSFGGSFMRPSGPSPPPIARMSHGMFGQPFQSGPSPPLSPQRSQGYTSPFVPFASDPMVMANSGHVQLPTSQPIIFFTPATVPQFGHQQQQQPVLSGARQSVFGTPHIQVQPPSQ